MKKITTDPEKKNALLGRAIYLLVMLMIIISALLSPWVIYSMYQEVNSNISNADAVNLLTSKSAEKIDVALTYVAIDPIKSTATLTVSGYKSCTSQVQCESLGSTLLVSNFFMENEKSDVVPDYVAIPLPESSGTYEKRLTLPINGNIATYPYDTWTSNISIGIVDAKGEALGEPNNITLNVDENVSRLKTSSLKKIDKGLTNTKIPDLFAFSAVFERPIYVKFTTTSLVILLFFATLCTIAFTDHSTLIMGSAGITLGVWGARSLLIGTLPPDTTFIDMLLLALIILVLMSVALKVALHIKRGGQFKSL